jgi:signal transduction histidine kinase
VEVKDNGSGIPKEIQEKIFDPFFTTKGPEKGTGLGLAIISSILHQHHANISLESEVGKGTQFKVSFPAASRSESGRSPGMEEKAPSSGSAAVQ